MLQLQKNIPNLISLSRIILLLILFEFYKEPVLFITLYFLCGLSDILDGYIARKTNTASDLGAKLDSAADIILTIFILFYLLVICRDIFLSYIPIIAVVFIIRCISILYAARKYKTFTILHTYGNKLTGFLLFFNPIVHSLFGTDILFLITGIAAILSALEEGLIHLTSTDLDANKRSFFIREEKE